MFESPKGREYSHDFVNANKQQKILNNSGLGSLYDDLT